MKAQYSALILAAAFAQMVGGATAETLATGEPPAAVRARAWCPDNGDGTYTNPVFFGDWPDADVIRVGDYFYFISTSMHFVPSCPIARSKDLVNWEMAGYAVPRFDGNPYEKNHFNLDRGSAYRGGQWASTIRHHNGKFYVGFCVPTRIGDETKGYFSMSVADDVKGPWKRAIFPECLYDPSLFFEDDGKPYVIHGHGAIKITPLAADALSVAGKPEPMKKDWPCEGSHMYKIKGKYYLFSPMGGHGAQRCFRSDNLYGPYESKIVLYDTRKVRYGIIQGGLVQLKNGDWWCLIVEGRDPVGRTTRLEPVTWVDGWPMIGRKVSQEERRALGPFHKPWRTDDPEVDACEWMGVDTFKKPDVGGVHPIIAPATTDEFNAPALGLQWQWNHNPNDANWSLTERPGYMRLKAGLAKGLWNASNTLTQRVPGPDSDGFVELDLRGLKDGNIAGFCSMQQPYGFIAVQQESGKRSIVMSNNGKTIATVGSFTGDTVWFKIHTSHTGSNIAFAYSADGNTYQLLGKEMNIGKGLPWWCNRFSLFNFSTTETGVGGFADFNWFHLRMLATSSPKGNLPVAQQKPDTLRHDPGNATDQLPIGIDDVPYEEAVKRLAIPFRKNLPQLFVSGDSISVGYGAALKLALKDKVNVVHRRDLPTRFPAVPCKNYSGAGPSVIQLTRAMLSLPDYKPDVLLLNFGLHDTPGGAPAYEKNLTALLALVRQHKAMLVWVQTTSKQSGHRENPRIEEFNKISARMMAAEGVPVIDLNAFTAQLIAKHGPAKIIRPDQVHFTPFAAAEQGRYIAGRLDAILAKTSGGAIPASP